MNTQKSSNELRGKLVLLAWYNGTWVDVDFASNTSKGLKRLEQRYHEPLFKDVSMKIELYT